MPGNGGIGRGSVKTWLQDSDPNALSSASHGRARADASVGAQSNAPITLTLKFPDGDTKEVTLRGNDEVTFRWQ